MNWLLSEEPFDLQTEFGFSFLNYLMLGTSAAPLRMALEESGLGEALVGGGLEDELRQPTFCIGLKGVKAEDVKKVEELVMSTLEKLAKEGCARLATPIHPKQPNLKHRLPLKSTSSSSPVGQRVVWYARRKPLRRYRKPSR